MNKMQQQVKEFHLGFGHPVAEIPTMIDMELAEKRANWMQEEIREFLYAIQELDIVEAYDAILDILYFAVGTAVVMGLDIEPGFDEVQRSNMAKLGPDGKPILRASDGKIQKPEGWVPPQLAAVVARQFVQGER